MYLPTAILYFDDDPPILSECDEREQMKIGMQCSAIEVVWGVKRFDDQEHLYQKVKHIVCIKFC